MIQAPPTVEDRLPPMTPQLALRVALIGMFAFAIFAIIFFRLWFLQVLSSTKYVADASLNTTRYIPIAAPRGEILDRNGNVLVGSAPQPSVEIAPAALPVPLTLAWMAANHDRPPQQDVRVYKRLAKALGIADGPVACTIDGKDRPPLGTLGTFRMSGIACTVAQDVAVTPYANATIEQNVSRDVEAYLGERQRQFPGVTVQQKWVRQYPLGDLAAQLFGTVGAISCLDPRSVASCELRQAHFKGIPPTDAVGQSGLEYEYNKYLQGSDGEERVEVNALGQFVGYSSPTPYTAGENLQLSIDPKLQAVGQQALATSVAANGGAGGAFLALNPQNGQIYAMGSNPTFDPSVFTKPLSQATWQSLTSQASGDPLLNRAITSVGPTGSTFKPITATAALESGAWQVGQTFDDTGQFCFPGTTECLHNAGNVANGWIDLVNAIRVSDDVFFYNLGYQMNDPAPEGGALQHWAWEYGIGRNTGIDLPGAVSGLRPTPRWRASVNTLMADCMAATHDDLAKCPYAIWPTEPWTVGDNVNMGVGQGDVQVSPLQLAVVYAALANGGTIVTPHVGLDIQSPSGTFLQNIDPPARRHLSINPTYLQTILAGLRAAASQPGGTSADVMGSFPKQVYGKTGTAQYFNSAHVETDYAWYACFVPSSATTGKPIVVVVWVEKGGFGDVAAAPVARQILSQWFFGSPGKYIGGNSHTL